MIFPRPYDTTAAMAVLRMLDPQDHMEAEAARGARVSHLDLFADWHAMQAIAVESRVVFTDPAAGAQPFAVLMVVRTGAGGTASAALLARDHGRHRGPLLALARAIRRGLPDLCQRAGLTRIEARAWARHPTAAAFLTFAGFRHEADLGGFGADGRQTFRQFAYVPDPTLTPGKDP